MQLSNHFKTIHTDVLVVGSGGAGLRAALEARKFKAEVSIASKGPLGAGTCTLISGGGFKAPVQGVTCEDHLERTLAWGKHIGNKPLAEILVREAPFRLLELKEFGVNLIPRVGGFWAGGPPNLRGQGLTRPLTEAALRADVKALERVMVFDVIIESGRVIGAVALDLENGQIIAIEAKSVLLATGGFSQIYSRTDNPLDITGDGHAIAYRAGADLQDMEFTQFSPLGLAEPGLPTRLVSAGEILALATLRNASGEDLSVKYGLKGPSTQHYFVEEHSDRAVRDIGLELHKGQGIEGVVLLDLATVPSDYWNKKDSHAGELKALLSFLASKGLDAKKTPIRVLPLAHFSLGGVRINEFCETGIPGLYAACEVSGGIHGANRLGGNALTEAIVFGARAGMKAAQYAHEAEAVRIEKTEIIEKIEQVSEVRNREPVSEKSPQKMKERIKDVMWKYVGIARNESGLTTALKEIETITQDYSSGVWGRNPIEIMGTLEALNMLQVSDTVARTALHRKESRGMHFRTDYPEQDDEKWVVNLVVSSKRNEIRTIKVQE